MTSVRDEEPVLGPVHRVRVRDLLPADSPRFSSVDEDHVRTLLEAGPGLPPVIVHRETMRVIDGMHRLRAAQLAERQTIEVRYFRGSEADAFRLSVRTNVAHGLPLTMAERHAAAEQIMRRQPQLSDGVVADTSGLSDKTVGAIRRRLAEAVATRRVGRDGKVRPLDTSEGRRLAGRLLTERPEASMREVAREAGISVGTVRDVRDRLRQGREVVPAARTVRAAKQAVVPEIGDSAADIGRILQGLQNDPALRYTDSGRATLRWLAMCAATQAQLPDGLRGLPPHCAIQVARIAREVARTWSHVAQGLERSSESA